MGHLKSLEASAPTSSSCQFVFDTIMPRGSWRGGGGGGCYLHFTVSVHSQAVIKLCYLLLQAKTSFHYIYFILLTFQTYRLQVLQQFSPFQALSLLKTQINQTKPNTKFIKKTYCNGSSDPFLCTVQISLLKLTSKKTEQHKC